MAEELGASVALESSGGAQARQERRNNNRVAGPSTLHVAGAGTSTAWHGARTAMPAQHSSGPHGLTTLRRRP
eukprot:3248305-Lingulodinium_polyedra.AAC.1